MRTVTVSRNVVGIGGRDYTVSVTTGDTIPELEDGLRRLDLLADRAALSCPICHRPLDDHTAECNHHTSRR